MSKKLTANTSSEAEGTHVNASGGMSSPNIDYSLLDWEVISEMAGEMQDKCNEYGGTYPRDNWRKLTADHHLNSLVQHYAAYQADIGYPQEHLLHIAIRAMMAYAVYNKL
jgi:hypothetical protein